MCGTYSVIVGSLRKEICKKPLKAYRKNDEQLYIDYYQGTAHRSRIDSQTD